MEASNFGFLRVAACSPRVWVGEPRRNADEIVRLCRAVFRERQASVLVFPELCVTGYTCEDLFHRGSRLQ